MTSPTLAAQIADKLPATRFYGAKTAGVPDITIIAHAPGPADTTWLVVRATTSGGDFSDLYQLVVDEAGTDVLRRDDVATAFGDKLAAGEPVGPSRLHVLSEHMQKPGTPGKAISGEQSNTSIIYGDEVMVKYFRKLAPGQNPDVELLEGLSAKNCPHIAQLRGYVTTSINGCEYVTAMIQDFAAGALDGWKEACRFAADGLSFTDQAKKLGEATGRVHADLASSFGTKKVEAATIKKALHRRLKDLSITVPVIAKWAEAAAAVYDAIPDSLVEVQRVHGDLHLGQTLLVGGGRWLLIDFEGEPARPIAQRRAPDSALRDLAGMIRSFDYAAHFLSASGKPASQDPDSWFNECSDAFLEGAHAAHSPLLDAYILDKALYEVAYEANNRPDWVDIPLSAVTRLTGRKR